MSDLRKLIVDEFGQYVLIMPDIFERGWSFPISDAHFREARENVNAIFKFLYPILIIFLEE
ncbi:hypothetical protein HY637_03040 [Candidatus Woesearchaeota archaeon]|nr:hypothetical protein [Candidatus Woesearchaeota archaeon]